MRTDNQNIFKGTSIFNRRRGLKAAKTRIENLAAIRTGFAAMAATETAYKKFELETYGGQVKRTILRTPILEGYGDPMEIDFLNVPFECSGFAEVIAPEGSEFAEFSGKQIQYLLTLDEIFLFPSPRSAVAEILDSGAKIRTRKAIYELVTREVVT